MKKRIIIWGVIGVVLIVCGFICYRVFMIAKNYVAKVDINSKSIFRETINIETEATNPVKIDDLSSYFVGYEEKNHLHILYDEENKAVAFYSYSVLDQYVYSLNEKSFALYSENDNATKGFATTDEMKTYLKNNNIKNDIDLINHIKENYYFKSSLFSSNKELRINKLLNSIVDVTLPRFSSISLIKGLKEGYILNINYSGDKVIKEVHLLNGKKQYIILLAGDITSEEIIVELVENIVFE
ncbi:MAG: hypothetical protein J5892_01685 [Bacilli bacterium]|nr:hypothetical protein [Bacilli bacterium]